MNKLYKTTPLAVAKKTRLLTLLLIAPLMLLSQSCCVLAEHVMHMSTMNKDVSKNPQRGAIVGKYFRLCQDVYIIQNGGIPTLLPELPRAENPMYNKKNPDIRETFPSRNIIPKGTILQVSQVLVPHLFGGELCRQYVVAKYPRGKRMRKVDISSLFKSSNFHPDQEFHFIPDDNVMEEVGCF